MPQNLTKVVVLGRRGLSHPRAGGAEHYVHEIFKRLTEDYDVTILSENRGTNGQTEDIDGIKYVNVGGPFHRFTIPLRFLAREGRDADILIDHQDVAIPWCSPLFARTPKISIIHQIVKEIFYYELSRPWSDLAFFGEPAVYKLYTGIRIVASAPSTAADLVKLGIPEERISVVTPGRADTNVTFSPLSERNQSSVISVSRLMHYKGLQHVLGAFRQVLRSRPNAILKIAGSGPYEQSLRNIAWHLGVSKSVHFLGRVSDNSKFDLFRESRVAVATSVRDGYGISVIDANSVGTPVVGWDVPGLRDSILDKKTGLLAPFHDETVLADRIVTLLTDDSSWTNLSDNALNWASQHSWERSAREFQRTLDTTIS